MVTAEHDLDTGVKTTAGQEPQQNARTVKIHSVKRSSASVSPLLPLLLTGKPDHDNMTVCGKEISGAQVHDSAETFSTNDGSAFRKGVQAVSPVQLPRMPGHDMTACGEEISGVQAHDSAETFSTNDGSAFRKGVQAVPPVQLPRMPDHDMTACGEEISGVHTPHAGLDDGQLHDPFAEARPVNDVRSDRSSTTVDKARAELSVEDQIINASYIMAAENHDDLPSEAPPGTFSETMRRQVCFFLSDDNSEEGRYCPLKHESHYTPNTMYNQLNRSGVMMNHKCCGPDCHSKKLLNNHYDIRLDVKRQQAYNDTGGEEVGEIVVCSLVRGAQPGFRVNTPRAGLDDGQLHDLFPEARPMNDVRSDQPSTTVDKARFELSVEDQIVNTSYIMAAENHDDLPSEAHPLPEAHHKQKEVDRMANDVFYSKLCYPQIQGTRTLDATRSVTRASSMKTKPDMSALMTGNELLTQQDTTCAAAKADAPMAKNRMPDSAVEHHLDSEPNDLFPEARLVNELMSGRSSITVERAQTKPGVEIGAEDDVEGQVGMTMYIITVAGNHDDVLSEARHTSATTTAAASMAKDELHDSAVKLVLDASEQNAESKQNVERVASNDREQMVHLSLDKSEEGRYCPLQHECHESNTMYNQLNQSRGMMNHKCCDDPDCHGKKLINKPRVKAGHHDDEQLNDLSEAHDLTNIRSLTTADEAQPALGATQPNLPYDITLPDKATGQHANFFAVNIPIVAGCLESNVLFMAAVATFALAMRMCNHYMYHHRIDEDKKELANRGATAKPATSRHLNKVALLVGVLVLSLDGNAMMVDAHNATTNGTLQRSGMDETAAVMVAPLPFAGAQARRGLQVVGYAMTDATIGTTYSSGSGAIGQCEAENAAFDCPNSQATYGAIGTWDTSSITAVDYSKSTCSSPSPFFFTRSCESNPPSCARDVMSGEWLWSTSADMSVRAYNMLVMCGGSTLPHGSVSGRKLIQSGYFSVADGVSYHDVLECVHLLFLFAILLHTQPRERSSLVCAREGVSGERLWSTPADMFVRAYICWLAAMAPRFHTAVFYGASSFNQDISAWQTGSVESMLRSASTCSSSFFALLHSQLRERSSLVCAREHEWRVALVHAG
eukprot:COSAG06_NODE_2615_length_6577_cov_2.658537_3_plen_1121_part_00